MWVWGRYVPTQPEPEPEPVEEHDEVRAWRVVGAMGLGYEFVDAVEVAESGVDLHRLSDLLDRGATHEQAFLILV